MFSLNTPVKYHLSNSPLVQVIAQVRFPLIARLQTLSGVVDLQENLRPVFPFMERREVATLAMTIGGVAASPLEQEPSTSWLFTNESGWELAVDAGSATLTAKSNYQGFDDLYELLESVITALADEGLRRCDRLGLRFINVAELDVNDLQQGRNPYRSELLGWPGSGILDNETMLESSVTQTRIQSTSVVNAPTVNAIVHHGYVPANAPLGAVLEGSGHPAAFLLDLDLFVQEPQLFDRHTLLGQFVNVHDEVDRFFRWSLTEEGERRFGLVEK